jgi:tetratricopeptide (TPR) repeat protein
MLLQSCHDVQAADAAGRDLKAADARELFKGLESFGQGFVTQEMWLKFFVTEGRPGKTAPPSAKKDLIEPLHQALKSGGVKAVTARYRELKASAADAYDFNEYVLNALGYHLLLTKNRPADALVIFQLNVEEYPKAFNAYDSLGEGYLANGQRDLAIQSYRKALELNPKFENAQKMLQKLQGEKPAKP